MPTDFTSGELNPFYKYKTVFKVKLDIFTSISVFIINKINIAGVMKRRNKLTAAKSSWNEQHEY